MSEEAKTPPDQTEKTAPTPGGEAGQSSVASTPPDQPAPSEQTTAESLATTVADTEPLKIVKKPAAEAPAKPALPAKPASPAATGGAAKPPAKPTGPTYNDISEDPLLQQLKAKFGEAVQEPLELLGQQMMRVARDQAHDVLRFLRDDGETQFDFLTDLTAVHYPDKPQPFEVIYFLYSFPRNARLRVKVGLADGESLESVCDLWGTANWMERECYDMLGVHFDHHPDLRRILLPPDWDGHPLRKEHQLEYKENDWVRCHLEIREVHPETDLTGKYEMTEFVKANR